MRIASGFRMRTLCNEHIVVGEGMERVDFNRLVSMNDTAAYVWEQLCGREKFDAETVCRLLLEKYDVTREVAYDDSRNLIKSWADAGLLED